VGYAKGGKQIMDGRFIPKHTGNRGLVFVSLGELYRIENGRFTAICASCLHAETISASKKEIAIKILEENGWMQRIDGLWVCQICIGNQEEE
jgi:hypothetical protein